MKKKRVIIIGCDLDMIEEIKNSNNFKIIGYTSNQKKKNRS